MSAAPVEPLTPPNLQASRGMELSGFPRNGQVVQARVIAMLDAATARLALLGQTIDVSSPRALQVGTNINVAVVRDGASLKLVMQQDPQTLPQQAAAAATALKADASGLIPAAARATIISALLGSLPSTPASAAGQAAAPPQGQPAGQPAAPAQRQPGATGQVAASAQGQPALAGQAAAFVQGQAATAGQTAAPAQGQPGATGQAAPFAQAQPASAGQAAAFVQGQPAAAGQNAAPTPGQASAAELATTLALLLAAGDGRTATAAQSQAAPAKLAASAHNQPAPLGVQANGPQVQAGAQRGVQALHGSKAQLQAPGMTGDQTAAAAPGRVAEQAASQAATANRAYQAAAAAGPAAQNAAPAILIPFQLPQMAQPVMLRVQQEEEDSENNSGEAAKRTWTVNVSLDAGSLGLINIGIGLREGSVSVRLAATNAEGAACLSTWLPELKTSLEQAEFIPGELSAVLAKSADAAVPGQSYLV